MDVFEIINKNRIKYNFPSKEYKAIMLNSKDLIDNKLELCTCKYYLLKSNKYLKKNIKLSPYPLYTEYINCLLTRNIEDILILRSKLEPFDSFINELDNLLTNLNYNINNIKSQYYWNDIEITFNTEKKKNDYINNVYKVEDKKYNNQLVIFTSKVDNKIKSVKRLLKKDITRIGCIKNKFKVLLKISETFLNYLSDNYVESEYLNNLKNEVKDILDFYDNKIKIGLKVFYDVENEILASSKVKNKSEMREDLISFLSSYFVPTEDQVDNIPFLPDFYDIAYDYIKYPSIDKNMTELINNMSINK